ncbi:hypothetical protein PIB30_082445, partial [Stylosanthes scabra]|nr:hypothetical protein [Stylosanthes scabra]
RPWVNQRRMIRTMLRALLHPRTLRKAVMAGRKPGQLAVLAISSRHRLQSQGWRTCHAFFSSLI